MFKINRTTEYGLIALQHMTYKKDQVTSAREISDRYDLPFEITAKTLQRLKDTGIIQSAQGAKGGYTLKRQLNEIPLAAFLQLMEGPQAVVACSGTTRKAIEQGMGSFQNCAHPCEYEQKCEIKPMMNYLNDQVLSFLGTIRLSDLIGEQQKGRKHTSASLVSQ